MEADSRYLNRSRFSIIFNSLVKTLKMIEVELNLWRNLI